MKYLKGSHRCPSQCRNHSGGDSVALGTISVSTGGCSTAGIQGRRYFQQSSRGVTPVYLRCDTSFPPFNNAVLMVLRNYKHQLDSVPHRSPVSQKTEDARSKIQVLVYDLLPPTTAMIDYAIGLQKNCQLTDTFSLVLM